MRAQKKNSLWIPRVGFFSVVAVFLSCSSPRPFPAGALHYKESTSLPFRAGASKVDLTPPWKTSLAGYGVRHGRAMEGIHDRPSARAIYFKNEQVEFALVAVDLLIVPSGLRSAVERRLAGEISQGFLLAATHTHGGPGNYDPNILAQMFAFGGYRPQVREFLVDRIVEALRQAKQNAKPARLAFARGEIAGLNLHRRDPSLATDDDLAYVRIESTQAEPIGSLVVYAAHPTVLGPEILLMNGDFPGFLCRGLEKEKGGVVLFFNGAAGEVAPHPPGSETGFAAAEALGRALAQRVRALHEKLEFQSELSLISRSAIFQLPKPDAGSLTFFPLTLPLEGILHLSVPKETILQSFTLGPVTFVGFPCDLGARIGQELKVWGGPGMIPVSYADGYVGYVIDRDSYRRGWYESKMSFYGPGFGEYLLECVRALFPKN